MKTTSDELYPLFKLVKVEIMDLQLLVLNSWWFKLQLQAPDMDYSLTLMPRSLFGLGVQIKCLEFSARCGLYKPRLRAGALLKPKCQELGFWLDAPQGVFGVPI